MIARVGAVKHLGAVGHLGAVDSGGGTDNILVFDSFTDANGTMLSVHTPDIDVVGGGWSAPSNSVIQNNKWDGIGGSGYFPILTNKTSVTVSIIPTFVPNRDWALFTRGPASTEVNPLNVMTVLYGVNQSRWRIQDRIAGSTFTRAQITSAATSGNRYYITDDESTVSIYDQSKTLILSATCSAVSSGYQGFRNRNSGTNTYDDFYIWDTANINEVTV